MKGDCWDDIKEAETSPASLGRLFCGMRDLGKSNCFFFASSYVKHTISPQARDVSSWVQLKLKLNCGGLQQLGVVVTTCAYFNVVR